MMLFILSQQKSFIPVFHVYISWEAQVTLQFQKTFVYHL